MTKLKKGKVYISYKDLCEFLGLEGDTHFEISDVNSGIDIKVVTTDNNTHSWLSSYGGGESQWKVIIPLVKPTVNKLDDIEYAQKFADLISTLKEMGISLRDFKRMNKSLNVSDERTVVATDDFGRTIYSN